MADDNAMSLESDIPVVFFAPYVSPVTRIPAPRIDQNGHMDIAHYDVLFDRALDQVFGLCGLSASYTTERNQSMFVVESRNSYRQELTEDDPVRVTIQVLAVDDKRVHCYLEARHALDGWVAASSERLTLHVDLNFRRATAFPAEIRRRLEELGESHAPLPRPERVGLGVVMPEKRVMN